MAKIRIHELAKELEKQSKDILGFLQEKGVEAKSASSSIEEDMAETVREAFGKGGAKAETVKEKTVKEEAPAKAAPAAEKQEKEEAKAEEEQMLKTVLNGIPDKDQNEEYFNIVMQAEPIQIIKSGDNLQGSADSTTMQKILPFFAGILIVTVIFTYIKRRKKQ